jgi:hypothetical protein
MSESAYDAAIALAAALEQHGVRYAIGGALAYGVWGIPRATMDVDINVFVSAKEITPVLDAIRSIGGSVDDQQAELGAQANGMFVARLGSFRLDVFTDSIPFCAEAARTRVRIFANGQEAWFLSAEALSVFKMMFFRPKDIIDLERLIEVRGSALDTAYVRSHLIAMVGPSDDRVTRWDALTERARTDEYEVETPLVIRGSQALVILRRTTDGSTRELELESDVIGTLLRGDRVRLSTSGSLELIARASDPSPKK